MCILEEFLYTGGRGVEGGKLVFYHKELFAWRRKKRYLCLEGKSAFKCLACRASLRGLTDASNMLMKKTDTAASILPLREMAIH